MRTDYGVRIIRAYQDYSVGQVIYPPGLLRDELVSRGFVERIKDPVAERRPVGRPRKDR